MRYYPGCKVRVASDKNNDDETYHNDPHPLPPRLRGARLAATARPRTWCTPTPCTFPSVHC